MDRPANKDCKTLAWGRTMRQVRLRERVEGLSIIALSYYAVGLLGYLLKGFGAALSKGLQAKMPAALSRYCSS